jgi:hypothetical protein
LTVALVIEGVVIIALLALLGLILRWHSDERDRREVSAAAERAELLNRIQAPERLPMSPAAFAIPELEDDDSAMAGTIIYDERYGEEGD